MKFWRVEVFAGVVLLSGIVGISPVLAGNPFEGLGKFLKEQVDKDAAAKKNTQAHPPQKKVQEKRGGGAPAVASQNISYTGYSENFLSVKNLISEGKADKAYEIQQKKLEESKKDANLLFSLEQATIALDTGKLLESRKHLAYSEQLLKVRMNRSVTSGFFGGMGTEAAKLVGFSEFGEYDGEAYERILMLNFKSITYMLEGSRKAYNVTRRAIDWQNIDRKEFEEKIKEVKEKIKEEEASQAKKGKDTGSKSLFSVISSHYKNTKSKVAQVPNAFVNPFGFYMAGIVQEFDSYEDSSLRDNARISYKKALDLNPDSEVIKQAIKEVQEKAPSGKRLVQIVVADGFAPEKKVLRFDYRMGESPRTIPIKLTIYEPDESLVDRIEVQNADGTNLASLSEVADIDAITLRHQQDSLPEQYLRLALTVIRTHFVNELAAEAGPGILGGLFKKVVEDTSDPDTRSWMSMPKKVLAARLYLPKDSGALRLVSYDKAGKILANKELTLDTSNHNFVYARSLDKVMYINQSKKMWVALR